jgi:hypothetical protein
MPKHKRYPGSIRQRGDTWQVRLFVAGERHTFTTGGTRTDAENLATRKTAELEREAQRKTEGLPDALSFSALVAEFERDELPTLSAGTQAAYQDSFKVLRAYFAELGNPQVHRIGRRHVKRFMAWRRVRRVAGQDAEGRPSFAADGTVSALTVAKDLRTLRGCSPMRWTSSSSRRIRARG